MKDIYTINLTDEMFEKIIIGKKNTHLEINDKQHSVLAVGNQLTFVCEKEDEKCEVKAVVENLLYFSTIKEAVETIGKESCGFKPSTTYEKTSDVFLTGESYENIEKYGIVAIVFKTIQ